MKTFGLTNFKENHKGKKGEILAVVSMHYYKDNDVWGYGLEDEHGNQYMASERKLESV